MYPLYALLSMLSSGFTLNFWFMTTITLTSCLTTCDLFHQPPALILLYHEYPLIDIVCYLPTCSCMLVLMTRF